MSTSYVTFEEPERDEQPADPAARRARHRLHIETGYDRLDAAWARIESSHKLLERLATPPPRSMPATAWTEWNGCPSLAG